MNNPDAFSTLFAPEPQTTTTGKQAWKVLLVDDEADIHAALHLAMGSMVVEGLPLQLFDANSNEQAKTLLTSHPDMALLLLDVVMESEQAGLDLVRYIRQHLGNRIIQIILVTGQPGYAPQRPVVSDYEIDGYRLKSELTADKIFTSVYTALRTCKALRKLDHYQKHLEKLVAERTHQVEEMLATLRNERDRAQSFLDIAGVIIVALDRDGHITLINRMGCDVLGVAEREILGESWFDLFVAPLERQTTWARFHGWMTGHPPPPAGYENEVLTRNGEKRLVAWRIALIRDPQGEILGSLASGEDITNRRQLEERLRQGEKLEAIGVLSGGVAHNFNNILAIILGNAELTQWSPARTKSSMKEIITAAERGRELVNHLLAFSRPTPLSHKLFIPETVIQETARFMGSVLPSAIQLTTEITRQAGMLLGDASQLQQMVLNLVTNAGHALGEQGGEVKIGWRPVPLNGTEAHPLAIPPGDYFELTVQDNGPGMTRQVKDRIFEPFFTTKEPGKGTGMGLAIVHGTVRQCQGSIVCESTPGQGTLFRIHLPRHPLAPSAILAGESKQAGDNTLAMGKILFVDDESQWVNLAQEMLKVLGYSGECFADPILALERFRENPDGFAALVTDQQMPGMTGLELTREIHTLRPGLPILLCTGFSDVVSREEALRHGVAKFLLKPVRLKLLDSTLKEMLGNL